MCTAASLKKSYFGRNLDYDFSYGEKIVIVPRNYKFEFCHVGVNDQHYAIIGVAHVADSYPMFYDAMNEKGLAIAGLNFVGNASYNKPKKNKTNVAQFEFISYLLANFKNVDEVVTFLKQANITNTMYNSFYPISSLHWIVRDLNKCVVIESTKNGLFVYDNEFGVLTNNPPFPFQLDNLKNYINLSNEDLTPSFASKDQSFYSRGTGGIGLPGDLSSKSRFVRAAFNSYFSLCEDDELSNVNQFFHILDSVSQLRGCCKVKDKYEITIYSSCMNLKDGIYYYKTYDNSTINGICLNNENLDSSNLITFEMKKEDLHYQN